MQVSIAQTFKLTCILTLAFSFTAMAQDNGNTSAAAVAAVTAPANQFLFVPLGNVSNNPFT